MDWQPWWGVRMVGHEEAVRRPRQGREKAARRPRGGYEDSLHETEEEAMRIVELCHNKTVKRMPLGCMIAYLKVSNLL